MKSDITKLFAVISEVYIFLNWIYMKVKYEEWRRDTILYLALALFIIAGLYW